MKNLGLNGKSLSMDKLMSAGLLAFTVPQNTTLAVKENGSGWRLTGFMNSDNLRDYSRHHLIGWGLRVFDSGTFEGVWNGWGDCRDGVWRNVNSSYNDVIKIENEKFVLGRRNFSDGTIKYWVDGEKSTTFN